MTVSKPLSRSLDIMDVVSAHPSGATMTEVSARLQLPPATVFRMVRNLTELGYLEGQGRHSRYRLGKRFLRQYHNSVFSRHIVNTVRPALRYLTDLLDEVIYLNALVIDEVQAVCAEFPSSQSARTLVMPGDDFPVHATASGKVLCAFQDPELMEKMLDKTGFTRYRPNTLVDRDSVRRELARVREQGYGTSDEELDADVFAVSVPVTVEGVGVMYSLGVNGVKSRMQQNLVLADTVATLRQHAARLGELLKDIHN